MSYCSNCGKLIESGSKFCPYCGSPTTLNNQRKQEFEGRILKCPNCGEILNSFLAKCPACGFELRRRKATDSIQELARRIQQIEAGREYEKKHNPNGLAKADEQEISVIQSFPIPNTIEDILEFMILASSNINLDSYDSWKGATYSKSEISRAWQAKCEQAYDKARLSFSTQPQFKEIQNIYNETQEHIRKKKKKGIIKCILAFGWIPVICIALLGYDAIQQATNPDYEIDKRESHLQYVVEQIEDDIADGKFKDAKNKAYTLTFDKDLSKEKAEYWEKKQEEILSQIKNAESDS